MEQRGEGLWWDNKRCERNTIVRGKEWQNKVIKSQEKKAQQSRKTLLIAMHTTTLGMETAGFSEMLGRIYLSHIKTRAISIQRTNTSANAVSNNKKNQWRKEKENNKWTRQEEDRKVTSKTTLPEGRETKDNRLPESEIWGFYGGSMNIKDVTPYGPVNVYRRFRGTCCLP